MRRLNYGCLSEVLQVPTTVKANNEGSGKICVLTFRLCHIMRYILYSHGLAQQQKKITKLFVICMTDKVKLYSNLLACSTSLTSPPCVKHFNHLGLLLNIAKNHTENLANDHTDT